MEWGFVAGLVAGMVFGSFITCVIATVTISAVRGTWKEKP